LSHQRVCRISAVSDDWVSKGCHVHIGRVEVSIPPDHLGGLCFRSPFSSIGDKDLDAAITLVSHSLPDPEFRRSVRSAVERAMIYLLSIEGFWVAKVRGRLREFKFFCSCARPHGTDDVTALAEFLRESHLGAIREGLTTEDVRQLLGEPDGISRGGWPQLWKYGSMQLGFHRTHRDEVPFLVSIALDFRVEGERPPESLGLSGWYPAAGLTYEEFRNYLNQEEIGVFGGVFSGPRQHLVVGPGVRITFVDNVLDSIQYTAKREPAGKQRLISVDRGLDERIRFGVSPSELCARWVEERARALGETVGIAATD
jgi:hypothetical protein